MPIHSLARALDQHFHALADPTRRAIVARLCKGPASVTEISAPFTMVMPTLLQHIRVLEHSGLITSQKTGRVRTCAMRKAAFDTSAAWLAQQRAVWEARRDCLDAYVIDLHAKEKAHARRQRKT